MRTFIAIVGFAFLYLAALDGSFALGLENCTQGSADKLVLGAIYSLILSFAGVICLTMARPPRASYIAALPPLFLLAWQFKFTIELAYGYLVLGKSACATLHDAPYEFDGRESYIIGLWFAMCFVPLIGLFLAFWRNKQRQSQS